MPQRDVSVGEHLMRLRYGRRRQWFDTALSAQRDGWERLSSFTK
jgi:hypothetical protein